MPACPQATQRMLDLSPWHEAGSRISLCHRTPGEHWDGAHQGGGGWQGSPSIPPETA